MLQAKNNPQIHRPYYYYYISIIVICEYNKCPPPTLSRTHQQRTCASLTSRVDTIKHLLGVGCIVRVLSRARSSYTVVIDGR